MSLDLTKVATQVINMIAGLKEKRAEQEKRLRYALNTINSLPIDLDDLKKKIKAGRTTWLVAEITEGLNLRYPLPPLPPDFTVIAADGSHIDVDRHQSTRCYLINTGAVALTYGSKPEATLSSTPQLYSEDKDLAITPPGGGREQMVEGTVLGVKRSVEECKALVDLASSLPPQNPALALLDGTLILWGLEAYPDFVTDALLINGMLKCLDTLKGFSKDRRLALASYISYPRSTDVLNVLRVAICPNDVPDCDKFCPPEHGRDCEGLNGVRDRDIFMNLLEDGERSALFISPSKIVKNYYNEHKVYFFYLRVGGEIARVEIPQWAAENEELLNLTHGLVFDQCQRGHGYPVALSEAHEQAVVTGADRENFRELVESTLTEEHLPIASSGKSASKRTRWV
ncbi:MAG: DNA double-strand break repair nuclease NurA [Dehalococcoidales bacterium]|nr:DNA double-strand break repair nuclease NurA [Dehalococcoidales bacterium]